MSVRKSLLWRLLTHKVSLSDVYYYLQGNYRYKLYYSRLFKWLIRSHIQSQINFRIKNMDSECYYLGQCKHCGCHTTQLQMADKTCEGLEYPPIVDEVTWTRFQGKDFGIIQGDTTWIIQGDGTLRVYNRKDEYFKKGYSKKKDIEHGI